MYLPLDLETTGLDPLNDHILEVGWAWLDNDLSMKKAVESHVVTPSVGTHDLIKANPFIQQMHGATGLLATLDSSEGTLVLSDIEDIILDEIQEHMDRLSSITLLGFGPHFDHDFIRNWMPRLNNKLHYRHFDVRTLESFFSHLGVHHDIVNLGKHRAGPDVKESIEVAQYYRNIVEEMSQG